MKYPALVAILAALLLGACAPAMTPVPVSGSASDLSMLAGNWAGEYDAPESERGGSIMFLLEAEGARASGDVVMTPRRGGQAQVGRLAGEAPDISIPPPGQVLRISFVRISGDRIRGTLDPYTDPDCGCIVQTVFAGAIDGERIEGSFETAGHAEHATRSGRWWVARTGAR
jgi:hypothetical protein